MLKIVTKLNQCLLYLLLFLIILYLSLICHNVSQIIKTYKLDHEIEEVTLDNFQLSLLIEAQNRKLVKAVVTCYTSEVNQCDGDPWTTASGHKLKEGDKIVANNCLDFGTKVLISGVEYTVEDRKNSRYGCGWFDIWYGSSERTKECFTFGKQNKNIYIVYEN